MNWEPTKYRYAIDMAAADMEMCGLAPTAGRLREVVNGPWEYPEPGTPVLVIDPRAGRIEPQTIRGRSMTSACLPAVVTDSSWILALAAEGVTWVRGWELTPKVARQLRDSANRPWEEE